MENKNYSLNDFLRFPIKKIKTYSGLDLVYYENCSASGEIQSQTILNIIKKTGKEIYRHGHEWCCGHGAIGIELLHQGICEKVSLSDKFLPAVISAEFSIALNNWQQKAQVYQIKEFSSLPEIHCDLIVADPPSFCHDPGETNQDGYRQTVDIGWQSHYIMFCNLHNRLTKDGDLYIYGCYYGSTPDIFETMAKENGLTMAGCYDGDPGRYLAHFKWLKGENDENTP
jgi:hypothetical protein